MIYKHALVQFGMALILFTLWAAADSWFILTGLSIASALSVIMAAFAGLAVATVVHEWFHFAGARFSGASYSIPEKYGFFVYDFDYENNSLRQFNIMSLAGQAGSVLTILLLYLSLPMDNAGRVMVVCAAIGSAIFGGMIEWPVLKRSQISGKPFDELSQVNLDVLKRSAYWGIGGGLGLWFVLT